MSAVRPPSCKHSRCYQTQRSPCSTLEPSSSASYSQKRELGGPGSASLHLPKPPPSLRFAWDHPFEVLKGIASGAHSWGPCKQNQLENYIQRIQQLTCGNEDGLGEVPSPRVSHVNPQHAPQPLTMTSARRPRHDRAILANCLVAARATKPSWVDRLHVPAGLSGQQMLGPGLPVDCTFGEKRLVTSADFKCSPLQKRRARPASALVPSAGEGTRRAGNGRPKTGASKTTRGSQVPAVFDKWRQKQAEEEQRKEEALGEQARMRCKVEDRQKQELQRNRGMLGSLVCLSSHLTFL